jgi:hypothetical protein
MPLTEIGLNGEVGRGSNTIPKRPNNFLEKEKEQ